ncbi:hypothetical protein LCGC14_2406910 [marine sediment metagenome]|uniref:NodB homology domain-containing protein n=1 Tax=marine sediment metagenome TaxID=412755 RepID=A0A0F9EN56_9ZZZZ
MVQMYSKHLSKDAFVIFLFHGVIEKDDYEFRNSGRKHLQAGYFRGILKDLLEYGSPITMDDVVSINKQEKRLPHNLFAITFDDGFENNYSVAVPILKELKIPATFYITTDFVSRNQMSWIDRIEYCLNKIKAGKEVRIDALNYERLGKTKGIRCK